MLFHHRLVVHLVNLIARQDEDLIGRLSQNALRVLKHGIRCAVIPAFTGLFHGGDDFDVLAQFRRENAPTVAHVADQIERFVLRENENASHVGVDTVGKGEVDNAVDAAERHGRLGSVARQRMEAFPGPAGQQNG